MWKICRLLLVCSVVHLCSGCAIVHRYPAYRGTVLELGTDKPIEGAGVLAVYETTGLNFVERSSEYAGYQAVITGRDGKFTIPGKFFFAFRPVAWFDSWVRITIYKRGYGNFPGSFPGEYNPSLGKDGKTKPELKNDRFPYWGDVTLWLPKLETQQEIDKHDKNFLPVMSEALDDKGFPPPGTNKYQFFPTRN